jgi:hypothetical protein
MNVNSLGTLAITPINGVLATTEHKKEKKKEFVVIRYITFIFIYSKELLYIHEHIAEARRLF